jgi:hypothetical protein
MLSTFSIGAWFFLIENFFREKVSLCAGRQNLGLGKKEKTDFNNPLEFCHTFWGHGQD